MPTRFCRSVVGSFALIGLVAAGACAAEGRPGNEVGRGLIRSFPDRVELPAVVQRAKFERGLLGLGRPGYHLLVWDDGGAAGAALFRSRVSDRAVLAALKGLGLTPGNALGMETWDDRKDPKSPASDKRIEGPGIEVLVRLPGRAKPLGLGEILTPSPTGAKATSPTSSSVR